MNTFQPGIEPCVQLNVSPALMDLQARLDPLTIYAVGGSVRDELLGLSQNDVDICGPHPPEEVAAACAENGVEVLTQTPKLGTLILRLNFGENARSFEYTAFRTESYSTGHRPDAVEFTDSMETDAARRDFTINALYMDLTTGDVFDPTNSGIDDLMKRSVRSISHTTMLDDGLRILRMLRFACEMGFSIDPQTYRFAKKHVGKLGEIAPERVNAEFSRLLLSDLPKTPWLRRFSMPSQKRALLALKDLGALYYIHPALSDLPDDAARACARAPRDLRVRLAALLYHLGGRCDEVLAALRYPNYLRGIVKALVEAASMDGETRMILAELGHERARLFVSMLLALAHPRADLFRDALADMQAKGAPFTPDALYVTGNDIRTVLDLPPSGTVGQIKHELWRACVADPSLNERAKLLDMLRCMTAPQYTIRPPAPGDSTGG